MNTNKGGSGQGQGVPDEKKLPVISKNKPGSGYFYGDNEEAVTGDYLSGQEMKNQTSSEMTDFGLVDGRVIHRGPNVSDGEYFGNRATVMGENSDIEHEDVADEIVVGDGGGVDRKAVESWQSTLSREEIVEGFEDYLNSGDDSIVYDNGHSYKRDLPKNDINEGGHEGSNEYNKHLDKNNSVGYDTVLDTMATSSDMGADNYNNERLSNDRTFVGEKLTKTMDTSLRNNREDGLSKNGEINSPEDNLQNSQEIAELETKKKALLGKVEKARLILDKLLADKEGLVNKTQFLGIGEESAGSLTEEIEAKKAEVDDLQKQISEVDRQLAEINHTNEQGDAVENGKIAEKKEVIGGDGRMIKEDEEMMGLDGNLEEELSNDDIGDGLANRIVDDKAGDSIEILPDGSLVGVIKDGQTVSDVIERLILKLNESEDRQEAKSMGIIAFGNFRLKFLKNMSVNKGMTKEEAISSWKNLLATLAPGDKIVIRLSDQGVELDIPVISGHTINTDKVI